MPRPWRCSSWSRRSRTNEAARRRICLVLEYEGTAYAGFQYQANAPSVQGTVERAVESLTGTWSRIAGAGRTDSGVHALGQVAAFDTESKLPVERVRQGLNHHLPDDIAVVTAHEAPGDFDPRRHALARVYRYTFLVGRARSPIRRRFVHDVGGPLATAAMASALAYVEGGRDFAPFAGALEEGRSTRRRIDRTAVWREGAEVHLEIEGDAFLPQQVRRMAGAVLAVGSGTMTMEAFEALADSGRPGAAERVLPARGLCLRSVRYRDFRTDQDGTTADNETHTDGSASA